MAPPPALVYANAAGTRAVDDKAAGTSEPGDANAEHNPQTSICPRADDLINNSDGTIAV